MTTDAAVGKKIRRVGKDGVEAAGVAVFGVNGVEQFEAVAVIQSEEGYVGGVEEAGEGGGQRSEGGGRNDGVRSAGFQHGRDIFFGTCRAGGRRSNRAVVAEFKMRGSNRIGMDKIAVSFFRRSAPIERLWFA